MNHGVSRWGEEVLLRCIVLESGIINKSIGIRYGMQCIFGKMLLAAISSAIM